MTDLNLDKLSTSQLTLIHNAVTTGAKVNKFATHAKAFARTTYVLGANGMGMEDGARAAGLLGPLPVADEATSPAGWRAPDRDLTPAEIAENEMAAARRRFIHDAREALLSDPNVRIGSAALADYVHELHTAPKQAGDL